MNLFVCSRRISDLGLELINYMVLRDINYFLDIYAGECVINLLFYLVSVLSLPNS